MNHVFSMIDLALLSQFLGLEISQSDLGIKVYQSKYDLDLLNNLNMNNFKASNTPFLSRVKLEEAHPTPFINNTFYRQLVGCLIYLSHTQTDIYYVVSVASRHLDQPHDIHYMESKRNLHVLQGTRTHGIHYVAKYDLDFVGFTDSGWASDSTDTK